MLNIKNTEIYCLLVDNDRSLTEPLEIASAFNNFFVNVATYINLLLDFQKIIFMIPPLP